MTDSEMWRILIINMRIDGHQEARRGAPIESAPSHEPCSLISMSLGSSKHRGASADCRVGREPRAASIAYNRHAALRRKSIYSSWIKER